MPSRFQRLLQNIGKACEDQSLTEAEVEKLFQEHGFFQNSDIRALGRTSWRSEDSGGNALMLPSWTSGVARGP